MSKTLEVIFSKQNKINHLSTATKESGYLVGLKYATDTAEKLYILSIVKQQNELNFTEGLTVLGTFHPADTALTSTAGLVTCTYSDRLVFTRAGSDETVPHTSIDRQELFKHLAQCCTLLRVTLSTTHAPRTHFTPHLTTQCSYGGQHVLNTQQSSTLAAQLAALDKSAKQKSANNPLARHEPVHLSLLTNKTSAAPLTAPAVTCHPAHDVTPACHVDYDLLCYLPLEITLAQALEHIASALTRQHEYVVKEFASRGPVKSYHYHVTGVDHYVTALYQPWQSDELQVPQRVKYHAQYLIDTNRPMFRINSAVTWHSAPTTSRLSDVHLSVPLPKDMPADSTLHVIDGSYEYYHYRQEQFNDEGWGCAYRSLQTLCSWLQHQHYMTRAVPAILDIQRALVELNDKPRSFINSREWIGAFEVSLVLDHWAQLPSKLINLTSGADLARPDIVRDLAAHFDRHGAPVMIGGGVLAYTLLGIMRHPSSGSVRFLILDPHYTGAEQLQSIVSGRWCAWHAVDLFRADCFYNLCLPQRPNCYT